MATIQRIASHLWFNTQAEEAARYYTSIFKNSSIGKNSVYGKAGQEFHGMPEGTVMTIEFLLDGQQFVALNGGPQFKFNESVSFMVNCETQEEIDYYWSRLSDGGDPNAQQCGWLKDKFGLSWQVTPFLALADMMSSADTEKSQRAMQEIMKMKKLDLQKIKAAYNGEDLNP